MPELEVRPVTNPTHTDSGKELRFAEHRSDFARVAAVRDSGGVYLDFDVFALRDVRPLRETGFAAIVGREVTDQINSGIFMTRHHSTLISAWAAEMHRDYDGCWVTHSNLALTRIAERLVAAPREVLIMERHALGPGGWGNDDYDRLWGVHDDVPSALAGVNPGDPLPPDASPPPQWAIDWSRTYLLHAFMPYRAHYTVKGFDYISPRYVLER
ncbi:glycosyl transferase, partial [Lasius niger]